MGLRVLVVEDDVINRRYIEQCLDSLGHHCMLTGSLAEALPALQQRRFDLCLADIRLPDGDGRELRAYVDQGCRLLLMSGNAPGPSDQWLQKPLSIEDLGLAMEGLEPRACLADPLLAEDLPDLDDLAAGAALGAGLSVLEGLRQLLRRELSRDRQQLIDLLAKSLPAPSMEILHRVKASSALCGLPRLHSATHRLHGILAAGTPHDLALSQWQDAIERALKVIPEAS